MYSTLEVNGKKDKGILYHVILFNNNHPLQISLCFKSLAISNV